jgi:hypothetical protein
LIILFVGSIYGGLVNANIEVSTNIYKHEDKDFILKRG